jgi:uncharacterized cofD-like protein
MTGTRKIADPSMLNVVAIGGGTGLSTILRGLKRHVAREGDPEDPGEKIDCLTAIVTVSDDGGSSGRLRREFGVTPPGDIRNCMTALSDDEALLSQLFRFRFSGGQGLDGHNFGNLFLVALAEVTGDFTEAVKLSSAILKTRGDIFPATTSNVRLLALMDDGSFVRGETNITASNRRIVQLKLVPANAKPLPQTIEAIRTADLITVGPGSLFTSLVPNLLVRGISEAIAASTATKVFVCNLMTQANESLDLTASQHVEALCGHGRCKLFDYAMLNRTPVPEEMRQKYAEKDAAPIVNDLEALEKMGVQPILGDYLDESPIARHNASRIATDLLDLTARNKRESQARKTQGTILVDAIRK